MNLLLRAFVLAVLLVLTGCAATGFGVRTIAWEGPITVILTTEEDLDRECRRMQRAHGIADPPADRRYGGCTISRPYYATGRQAWEIWCAYRDAECLAHEFRHVMDPEWKH